MGTKDLGNNDFNFESSSSFHPNLSLLDQLNSQLEILDEEEFDLPHVDVLPSLESILNEEEEEDEQLDGDDLLTVSNEEETNLNHQLKPNFPTDGVDAVSIRSRESNDSKSRSPGEPLHSLKRSSPALDMSGSILRHVALKGITAQLVSAKERVGAGVCTAMSVSKLICVGTCHGLILVFEPSQALKCCLGSTQLGEQHGAVSALSINKDGSRVIAGYAKGHLCLFDVSNGKLLQNIPDAHTPFTAVLHIKWTDCPGLSVLSDCGGSVFELSVRRTVGLNSNESRCIFSGSRGEVCALEPLLSDHFQLLPPVIDTIVVAMATISKVIVVSLRPSLRVLFSHSLKGPSTTLPLLSWQFVIIQMPDGSKVVDPVLAFARQNCVYFFQVTHSSYGHRTFVPLQRLTVPYCLQGVSWLNSRTLVAIDVSEKLHVVDVKSHDELDVVDLASLGLVYASSHFKAMATGGNVSLAMGVAGERACYNSIAAMGSQVLLLGTKSFQVVTMRTWSERVDYLMRENRRREALFWLLEVLQGKAKSVVGLTHRKIKRSQLVREKIRKVLLLYLDHCLASRPASGNLHQVTSHFQTVIPCCVKVAVEAGFVDILFEQMWDMFSSDVTAKGLFLESLEPYIVSGDSSVTDKMTPTICQSLLSHFEERGSLESMESCVVHLPITCLDLHQTLTLSWSHGLYDAIFYVFTQGMKDYVSPLEELLGVLKKCLESSAILSDTQVALGNKILVYVSCCLAGRAYPRGDIAPNEAKRVKHEVFKCLMSPRAKNSLDEDPPYPFLRTLLRFDTRELLNVLALAFTEEEFTSELGLVQRQRVVDLLLQVMCEDDQFETSQVVSLFIFISGQISRGEIPVSRTLVDQVLTHLTCTTTDSFHEERQSSLLDLLQSKLLPKEYHPDLVLQKAESAQFFRVCEFLFEETGRHDRVLECYVNDKGRSHEVFPYVESTLDSNRLNESQKDTLKDQIVLHVESLMEIDCEGLVSLLLSREVELTPLVQRIVDKLNHDRPTRFKFLQYLFTLYNKSYDIPPSPPSSSPSGDRRRKSKRVPSSSSNQSPSSSGVDSCWGSVSPELHEGYIEMMCDFHPDKVCDYLQHARGYRLSETLQICRVQRLWSAEALLLERTGDLGAAFDVHLNILKKHVDDILSKCSEGNEEDFETKTLIGGVEKQVLKMVQVCHQIGPADQSDVTDPWFKLLDTILVSIRPSLAHALNAHLRSVVGLIVNHMVRDVGAVPAVLERVIRSPGYGDCKFEQIRRLLKDMVERYTYEKTLYSSMIRVLHREQLKHLSVVKTQRGAPLAVNATPICSLCFGTLYHPSSEAVIFECGHSFHSTCTPGTDVDQCTLCSTSLPYGEGHATSRPKGSTREMMTTMDTVQWEGLDRVSTLDASVDRLALMLESTEQYKKSDFFSIFQKRRKFSEEFRNRDSFDLRLAPPVNLDAAVES